MVKKGRENINLTRDRAKRFRQSFKTINEERKASGIHEFTKGDYIDSLITNKPNP